jgi:hypothetical protein
LREQLLLERLVMEQFYRMSIKLRIRAADLRPAFVSTRESNPMKWMKRTALAIAAGAALSFTAVSPGAAAPVGQSAATVNGAVVQSDSNIIDVRRRGHRGHRHAWRHHRHRHGGFRGWWVPFAAAPLLYGGYSYGNSCYQECRYYNGPGYCRYNWRRYC